jgi:hypothetical protein
LGFVIANAVIDPSVIPNSFKLALTKTAGDACPTAVFVKLKVTVHTVADTVPPDAAVSTSVPKLCVHTPVNPRRLDVDVTGKDGESAVCEPVSPVIVTVEPFARS